MLRYVQRITIFECKLFKQRAPRIFLRIFVDESIPWCLQKLLFKKNILIIWRVLNVQDQLVVGNIYEPFVRPVGQKT